MPTVPCFEMAATRNGWIGRMPHCPVEVRFSKHCAEQLQSRHKVPLEEVLISMPRARVEAENPQGRLVALSLTNWRVDGRLVLIMKYPAAPEEGAEVVTIYPRWNGDCGTAHFDIMMRFGLRQVMRRRFLDFLGKRCPEGVGRVRRYRGGACSTARTFQAISQV